MPEIKEGLPHNGAFIMSEANGKRSRENVMVARGLRAGTVLGAAGATATDVYSGVEAAGFGAATGILINATPAGEGAVEAAVIVRDAEVNRHCLVWTQDDDTPAADADIAAGIAALEALGIRAR